MKTLITFLRIMVFMPFIFICSSQTINAQGGNGGGGGETAGNNLSFPVIFADGGSKVLPGTMGAYSLGGEWWYVWGEDPIDPQAELFSCKPADDNPDLCEDGRTPGDGNSILYKAYIQKDLKNVWQAYNTSVSPGETLNINWIDWGDDLESVSWKINSKVRTEVVLLQDIDSVTQFSMRHVDSWGSDEVHGLQTTLDNEVIYGPGTQATIYSPNARLTIQKLNFTSESISPTRLIWKPNEKKWTETNPELEDIINEPIFNQAVSEAGTGPSFFNAEINVKGKIMFGYTWDVSNDLEQGEGHYRLTFSFDEATPGIGTAKFDEFTQIIVPIEEETTETLKGTETDEGAPGGGGIAKMDPSNNLTYMDVLIGEPGAPLSIKNSEIVSFRIYPNPTTSSKTVNIQNTNGNLVNIYNMLGQEVFRTKLNNSNEIQTLNLSILQSGLYFVKISDGQNTSVKKLIVK